MDPSGREEEERRVREAEERKRRREEMGEHRKQLQKDLLERERAVSNGKGAMSSGGVMSSSVSGSATGKNTTTSSASSSTNASPSFSTTTTTTTQPNFNPANPKFALLLKVSSASCPLPLTPETLSASLNLPPERITHQNSTVCAEFASAKDAAEVLAKIPFDAVRSGDWYLGYPPVELFESDEVVDGTDHSVQKKVKVTEEFESEVLKRLRERAKSKK